MNFSFFCCAECTPDNRRLAMQIRDDVIRLGGNAVDTPTPVGNRILFFDDYVGAAYHVTQESYESARVLGVNLGRPLASEQAWQLLRRGVTDILQGAAERELPHTIAARLDRWEQVNRLVDSPVINGYCRGRSTALTSALRQVVEIAVFSNSSVLILGESGVGKEVFARLIHMLDTRDDKRDLITVDCTTIVPSLSGSELFGHVRGAFTGANTDRLGAFAIADKGTLFLDEVGELPLGLQAELLRVVQERTYKPVGSNNWHQTSFRLICATNRNLKEEENAGRFRRDFYHRIAASSVFLPPLRDRVEDVPLLAEYFAREISGNPVLQIDSWVQEYLVKRGYPGNVRELRNLIARMVSKYSGHGALSLGAIPLEDRPTQCDDLEWFDDAFEQSVRRAVAKHTSLEELGRTVKNAAVKMALELEDGIITRAAARIGVSERALQQRRATALAHQSQATTEKSSPNGKWTHPRKAR